MFEMLKARYKAGFCTAEQLQRFVQKGAITQEEYEQIVNEES